MINYIKSAEDTLRQRGAMDDALDNLRKRQQRIIAENRPSGYPSASFSETYTSTSRANDAVSELVDLAEIQREIDRTEAEIKEIDAVLDQLPQEESDIIRAWYIDRISMDAIAEQMCYESRSTIYDKRNHAVADFAVRYFGAVAIGRE